MTNWSSFQTEKAFMDGWRNYLSEAPEDDEELDFPFDRDSLVRAGGDACRSSLFLPDLFCFPSLVLIDFVRIMPELSSR